jgi:Mg-chelatase subunit ChlD
MNEKQKAQLAHNPQPLYVTLILDETGSMQSYKGVAIAGFNQYVATLRREPAETRFTLTLFNSSKTEVRCKAAPVAAVQDLDVETYRPRDTTPLYDAIGRTLSAARREAPVEAKKLCVILTDGMENASNNEYTRAEVFALIKACEQQGCSCTSEPITMFGPPANRLGSRATTGFHSASETSA